MSRKKNKLVQTLRLVCRWLPFIRNTGSASGTRITLIHNFKRRSQNASYSFFFDSFFGAYLLSVSDNFDLVAGRRALCKDRFVAVDSVDFEKQTNKKKQLGVG